MRTPKIYMAVTADEYELPVFVARHPDELATAYDMNVKNVWSYITRGNVKKVKKGDDVRFIRVEDEGERK